MPRGSITRGQITDALGRIRIEVKPVGKLDQVIRQVNRLGPDVKEASIKAQKKVANEIAKIVKAHIRNQDLGWAPLSEEYAMRKDIYGLNSKTLWAYGNYYRAIEVWKPGNTSIVNVGVRKGKYTKTPSGKRSRLEIARIAAIHEFSSGKKIPRRPLWNPTIKQLGGARGLQKMYINSLIYHLRMKGIPITQFRNLL
jgi:hypothetical protein